LLDVAFLHPPSVISQVNLIKKLKYFLSYFSFSIAPPVQYLIVPMGLFSMASFLEDNSYSARIFNLPLEQILYEKSIQQLIKEIEAKIYAIDLHWFVHSDGAIEVARMCKKLHPNSKVVLGGITASFFGNEIIRNYPFIDIIVNGEGEKTMLDLVKAVISSEPNEQLREVKGITFRINNKIVTTPPRPPSDLNDFDFTRLRLMNHYDEYLRVSYSSFIPNKRRSFWLTIFRGCPFSCSYCGGGRETYYSIFNYDKIPLVRKVDKVVEDIRRLNEDFKVQIVRFGQDPEVLGKRYYSELFDKIKKEKIDIFAYNEAWNRFPSHEFLIELKSSFQEVNIAVSPDSALDEIRVASGRFGTNEELFKLADFLEKNEILTDIYFLIGLPGETKESCKSICNIADKFTKYKYIIVIPPFPFTPDPNSPMALNPSKYGIKLIFKTFKHYKDAFVSPDPIDWIAHETKEMTRREIVEMTSYCAKYVSSLEWIALEKKKKFELE